jgi:cell division septum initiation protein DivIVA
MTKNEIIYQVQLDLAKKAAAALSADNEELKQQIYKLEASLNKKASKTTKEDF